MAHQDESLFSSYQTMMYTATEYPAFSVLLRALSRNTYVTEVSMDLTANIASRAFQKLLTRTQTLKKMQVGAFLLEEVEEEERAAIAFGFANNTSLCDQEFKDWREADLAPVLSALQNHPTLQKLHLTNVPSFSGLEVLLSSHDSKVKELEFEGVDYLTEGL
jgi:hypothetical protein